MTSDADPVPTAAADAARARVAEHEARTDPVGRAAAAHRERMRLLAASLGAFEVELRAAP